MPKEIDTVTRSGDALTPADRAAAGAGQSAAVAEEKPAILATRRFEDESTGLVPRERFHHVGEMILDLSLRNPQHLCQLMG